MSKPTTHVLMVLDESGSMGHLADDVRGGFNTYLDGLAADTDGKYRVTAAKFGNDYQLLCNAAKLKDTPRLTHGNYSPGGMTALLDAIGKLITDFEKVGAFTEQDRVLLVIQTDGNENASREYKLDDIRKMITDREKTGRWSAIFVGAGPDTWQQAAGLGIRDGSTVSMAATGEGTRSTYTGLTRGTVAFASGLSGDEAAKHVSDAAQ